MKNKSRNIWLNFDLIFDTDALFNSIYNINKSFNKDFYKQ